MSLRPRTSVDFDGGILGSNSRLLTPFPICLVQCVTAIFKDYQEEYKGSAEVYLKVKESDRIYSDTSVNGDNIRFKLSEESDDNYETIPDGVRLKKLKRRGKR